MRGVVAAAAFVLLASGCAARIVPTGTDAFLGPVEPPGLEVATPVMPHVASAAERTGLPMNLILAVIWVESRFDAEARSPAGALGLMQLMPATAAALAAKLGVEDWDARDPAFNVMAGSFYLARLLERFEGDLSLALAAYNAGPARVDRWRRGESGLPGESRRYVTNVLAARDRFVRLAAPAATAAPVMDARGLEEILRRGEDDGAGRTP